MISPIAHNFASGAFHYVAEDNGLLHLIEIGNEWSHLSLVSDHD